MIFKLDFKEEKDIPYYFKCIICRKVPKHSKCLNYFIPSCLHELESCREVEQRALDHITFQCQACQKKVLANQKSKHLKECLIYHSNFQMQNQEDVYFVNQSMELFCKYCNKFNCQEHFINQHNNLGDELLMTEQTVELRQEEYSICEYCDRQICYYEINYHQNTCNLTITVCELCNKTITREFFIIHYQQCIQQFIVNLKYEQAMNLMGYNLLQIQKQSYNCNYRQGFQDNQLRSFFEDLHTDKEQ